jgi:hypothetical protein
MTTPSAPGIFSGRFWRDLAERVVSSAAGGALAAMGIDAFGKVHDVNPSHVLIGAGVAAAVSLLKGLVASTTGNKDSASFTV